MLTAIEPAHHARRMPVSKFGAVGEYLTPEEAARCADVTRSTIVRWCASGALRGCKVGGRWRVDPHDLYRLLTGGPRDGRDTAKR